MHKMWVDFAEVFYQLDHPIRFRCSNHRNTPIVWQNRNTFYILFQGFLYRRNSITHFIILSNQPTQLPWWSPNLPIQWPPRKVRVKQTHRLYNSHLVTTTTLEPILSSVQKLVEKGPSDLTFFKKESLQTHLPNFTIENHLFQALIQLQVSASNTIGIAKEMQSESNYNQNQ